MKMFRINIWVVVMSVISFIGCAPESLDWGDIWNTKEVCYVIKDINTNHQIEGAIIELIEYRHPDCLVCPINLDETSNNEGKACMNLTEGWSCNSAKVSAPGYFSKTFNGKPPIKIYLTPSNN